jgi:hypothetical protein
VSFFHLLHSQTPSREDADMLTWKLNRIGMFDSRSYYLALRDSTTMTFPCKSIWRVSFFVWIAAWGKILTCDNLMRRGYVMVGWCCMCKGSGESVDHLWLHCGVAWEVWNFIFRSFGVSWVLPERVMDLSSSLFNVDHMARTKWSYI